MTCSSGFPIERDLAVTAGACVYTAFLGLIRLCFLSLNPSPLVQDAQGEEETRGGFERVITAELTTVSYPFQQTSL